EVDVAGDRVVDARQRDAPNDAADFGDQTDAGKMTGGLRDALRRSGHSNRAGAGVDGTVEAQQVRGAEPDIAAGRAQHAVDLDVAGVADHDLAAGRGDRIEVQYIPGLALRDQEITAGGHAANGSDENVVGQEIDRAA